MKNLLLLYMLIFVSHGYGQSFQESLQRTYEEFEQTFDLQQKVNQANRFDLIASKWNGEWLAHFYAAYARTVVSYRLEEEKLRDAMLDKAEQSMMKTLSLLTDDSDETLVLEAYIANARLAVKPMSRYKKYGEMFDQKLAAALKINPNNPRINYLKGLSTFHTPKAFGGGTARALSFFEKAQTLFMSQQKGDVLKPYWGESDNNYYLQQCKN